MNKEKHPFAPKQADESKFHPYVGSDGLPITVTYKTYIKKCDEFKMKAKKYAKDNIRLQNSMLHNIKCGYESSQNLEEEVLLEREEHMKQYKKAFNVSCFDEDLNLMYDCSTGKSKRIRVIRELNQERTEEFSDLFDNKNVCWFTKYCTLSRFIQAARKVILLNRLKKVLKTLRTLTPQVIQEIENEVWTEEKTSTKDELRENENEFKMKCVC